MFEFDLDIAPKVTTAEKVIVAVLFVLAAFVLMELYKYANASQL